MAILLYLSLFIHVLHNIKVRSHRKVYILQKHKMQIISVSI